MPEVEDFIKELREHLNKDFPDCLKVPPNGVDLPEDDYLSEDWLNLLADALDNKTNTLSKGVPREST